MPKEMAYKNVVKVLEYEGWRLRKKTTGGSHYIFKKNGVAKIITLSPHSGKQKIKAYQIKEVVEILELEEKYGKK